MVEFDRTRRVTRRLEDKINYVHGIPYYQGRHVITSTSSIDGGVYLGAEQREAIVVDFSKDQILTELFEKAKKVSNAKQLHSRNYTQRTENEILRAVYESVLQALPQQDVGVVDRLLTELGVGEDEKVSLDIFLEKGIGVCRHDALASGALLERFQIQGYLRGYARVNRNTSFLGGHAWARWIRHTTGDVYILDIAHRFFGKLSEATPGMQSFYGTEQDHFLLKK